MLDPCVVTRRGGGAAGRRGRRRSRRRFGRGRVGRGKRARSLGRGAAVGLPFALAFDGRTFNKLYVNNNGNVTLDGPMREWKPHPFASWGRAIIAPYWADVDTRASGSGLTSYGLTTYNGHAAFCADWPNVGYYSHHHDKVNDFQMLIVSRPDVASGAFEIIFNYDRIQWETGDFDGGVDGLGGTSAAVGYSNGAGSSLQLAGSLVNGALLDANGGLIHKDRGSSIPGRYIFDVFP